MIEEFKFVLSRSNSKKIITKDNTILFNNINNSTGKTKNATFLINNYRFEISFSSLEEYDDVEFENFVKEFYEIVKV